MQIEIDENKLYEELAHRLIPLISHEMKATVARIIDETITAEMRAEIRRTTKSVLEQDNLLPNGKTLRELITDKLTRNVNSGGTPFSDVRHRMVNTIDRVIEAHVRPIFEEVIAAQAKAIRADMEARLAALINTVKDSA